MDDSRDSASYLIGKAHEFNSSPDNAGFTAVVTYTDNGRLRVSVQRKTADNTKAANEQYATDTLNRRLATQLHSAGISIDDITEAEQAAGRIGVTDFAAAKRLASDCVSVIRVANNFEGHRALSEEFSHLVIGAYRDTPLVKRAIKILTDKDVLAEILGTEYQKDLDFHDGNLEYLAEEALGQLLQKNLVAQTAGTPKQAAPLLERLFKNIRAKFKKLDAEAIEKAIVEADGLMGQMAKNILDGQLELTRDKVAGSARKVQFNALSERIETNIKILKDIRATEIKRLTIFFRSVS